MGVKPDHACILAPAPAYGSDRGIAVARQYDGKMAVPLASANSVRNCAAERKCRFDLRQVRVGGRDLFSDEFVAQAG